MSTECFLKLATAGDLHHNKCRLRVEQGKSLRVGKPNICLVIWINGCNFGELAKGTEVGELKKEFCKIEIRLAD